MTKGRITQLQKIYIDITSRAAEYMKDFISVRTLRYSVLCLPQHLKKEHKMFVKEAKCDIKEAETSDDIFYVVSEHRDYLNYSLLQYLTDLYGNDELKKEMADFVKKIEAFRRETRLAIFCEVCGDDKPEENEKFAKLVTKHLMNWATATLEDVERFRRDICHELSLYEFSLNLKKVVRGCVEITWQFTCSLVVYIKDQIQPSSPSMMRHNVSTFTIYDPYTGIYM